MPRPTRSGLKVLAVGLLMLAPVLYVASVGPAYWVVASGRAEPEQFRGFYAPLNWAMNRAPILREAVVSYSKWWKPAPRGRC